MSFDLNAMRGALVNRSWFNRLVTMLPDERQHFITFKAMPADVLATLMTGEWVSLSDRRLTAVSCWRTLKGDLSPEDRALRMETFRILTECTLENTGAYVLSVVLRMALVKRRLPNRGETVCAVPLGLLPVRIDTVNGEPGLRVIGPVEINEMLPEMLGMGVEALPPDPMAWRREDLAPFGVEAILEAASLGFLDVMRSAIRRRTDPARHPHAFADMKVQRLLRGSEGTSWPYRVRSEKPSGFRLTGLLDDAQIAAASLAIAGQDLMIESAPGTGKTRTLTFIVANAIVKGQTILFLGGRMSAIRSFMAVMPTSKEIGDRTLILGGETCDPRTLAARLDVEPCASVSETLMAGLGRFQVLATTPTFFAMHVSERLRFDLLVIDEASLVPLIDALPAVAACEQIVIVGDRHQGHKSPLINEIMSPDRYVSDPPTVMDGAEAARMPTALLPFHYRSRHPALMALANVNFYGGRVTLCPSPMESEWYGTAVRHVPGVYERVTNENRLEAEAVVDEIVRQIASGNGASIGVVAMSGQQAELIQRLFDERGIDASSVTGSESLLITDYDLVQGYERDVIILSLLYAHDPDQGEKLLDYGALTYPRGDRVLNVITTRARNLTVAIASFPLSAIPVGMTREHRALFTYLHSMGRPFFSETTVESGPLDAVAALNGWEVRTYRDAFGMYEPRIGWFPVLVYVTGRYSAMADASNLARFRNGRWTVHEITLERYEAILADEALQCAFAEELRDLYQPEIPKDEEDSEVDPLDGEMTSAEV